MTQVSPVLAPVPLQPSSDRDLLVLFLSLSKTERKNQFADTAQTAEIVGMSRRTVQLWIELGQIRAVRVGKKYHVHLDSVHGYLHECLAVC
jgi:excisionase family DNA binding protein